MVDTYVDVVLPTYRMEPDESERFYPSVAKSIADSVLMEELRDQIYDEEDSKLWTKNISDKVRELVRENLSKTRYKIIVQTTVGQMRDQAIRVASRCLWDPTTDNYASTSFTNETIFCTVVIFCIYTD